MASGDYARCPVCRELIHLRLIAQDGDTNVYAYEYHNARGDYWGQVRNCSGSNLKVKGVRNG